MYAPKTLILQLVQDVGCVHALSTGFENQRLTLTTETRAVAIASFANALAAPTTLRADVRMRSVVFA